MMLKSTPQESEVKKTTLITVTASQIKLAKINMH
jgi:hypothetical protein